MLNTTENCCIERYTDMNVSQCWSCQNCVGSLEVEAVFNLGEKKKKVMLPERRGEDMYMTSVYNNPCKYYKRKEAKNKIVMYLERKMACSEALDAFNEAWKLFKDYKEE